MQATRCCAHFQKGCPETTLSPEKCDTPCTLKGRALVAYCVGAKKFSCGGETSTCLSRIHWTANNVFGAKASCSFCSRGLLACWRRERQTSARWPTARSRWNVTYAGHAQSRLNMLLTIELELEVSVFPSLGPGGGLRSAQRGLAAL